MRGSSFISAGVTPATRSEAIFGLRMTYIEHFLRGVNRSLLRSSHLVLSALFVLSTTKSPPPWGSICLPLGCRKAGQSTTATLFLLPADAMLSTALQLAMHGKAVSPAALYDMFARGPFLGH